MTNRLERLEGVHSVAMDWENKTWTVTLKADAWVAAVDVRKAVDIGSLSPERIALEATGGVALKEGTPMFGDRFAIAVKIVKEEEKQKELQKVYDDLLAALKQGKTTFTITGEFSETAFSLESATVVKPKE